MAKKTAVEFRYKLQTHIEFRAVPPQYAAARYKFSLYHYLQDLILF